MQNIQQEFFDSFESDPRQGRRRHSTWIIKQRVDAPEFLYDIEIGNTIIPAELCSDLVQTSPKKSLLLVTHGGILNYSDPEKREQVERVREEITDHIRTKGLASTGAVKLVAKKILSSADPSTEVTVADGRFGPIPVVRVYDQPRSDLSVVYYPGPKEVPLEAVRGRNLRPVFDAIGNVFHKLMPCYLDKAVAYLEKIYYSSYRPQGVYFATELREFIAERIDTKVDLLVSSVVKKRDSDPVALTISRYRKLRNTADDDIAALCREIYAKNMIQIYEIELARELILLLANNVYAINRVPDQCSGYEGRIFTLIEQLLKDPENIHHSYACARLITAYEAFIKGSAEDSGDTVRAPEWAQRLDRVARYANKLRKADASLEKASVRVAYSFQPGIRDSEEFTNKLINFMNEQIGTDNLVVLPQMEVTKDAGVARLASLYFFDGIFAFHPRRMDEGGSRLRGETWQVIEPLVQASRLEKRIVVLGEPGSDFERLRQALELVPENLELCLHRGAIDPFAPKLEQLCRIACIWRNPGPEFDEGFRSELQRCLAEMRVQRTIDQVFCYRVYFSNEQWAVFRAVYEVCRESAGRSVRVQEETPWVELQEVYAQRFEKAQCGVRLSKASFNKVIKTMTQPEYGTWAGEEKVALLQTKQDDLVRDNALLFASKNWGDDAVPESLIAIIHRLVTELDSKISRGPSELAGYLIHRKSFGLEDDRDLIVGEQARRWSLMIVDELTGLRRAGARKHDLKMMARKAKESGYPTSILFIDIDNFKRINDTHGHRIGDRVLNEVSSVVRRACSERYMAYREGGEEITVLMANSTTEEARVLGERIRQNVRELSPERGCGCTVSIGVFTRPDKDISDPENAITFADQAMYEAKKHGKDRVVIHSSLLQLPSVN